MLAWNAKPSGESSNRHDDVYVRSAAASCGRAPDVQAGQTEVPCTQVCTILATPARGDNIKEIEQLKQGNSDAEACTIGARDAEIARLMELRDSQGPRSGRPEGARVAKSPGIPSRDGQHSCFKRR